MNNAQIAVVVGSGALAVVSQGSKAVALLHDLGGQQSTQVSIKSHAYPVIGALAFVVVATWFAGINGDTARIAIAVVIAVWLAHFYQKVRQPSQRS